MADEMTKVEVSKVVKAAMSSGVVDPKMTIGEITERLGRDIDEVAGYVLAWEKYVLVVSKEIEMTPTITMKRDR